MDTRDMVKILFTGADAFRDQLLDKQLLYAYMANDEFHYIEVVFKKQSFQHLTGIKIPDIKSGDFFDRCLARKISYREIQPAKDGTTPLKLRILENAIKGIERAQMVGVYDNSRFYLKTDHLVGNVHWCMGFVYNDKKNMDALLYANTLLNEDLRKIVLRPFYRVSFVAKKDKIHPTYSYKNITWQQENANVGSIVETLKIAHLFME